MTGSGFLPAARDPADRADMDKTAVKLLRAFEYMCREGGPLGVSALADKFKLTKSNAHRILRTLVSMDYAYQIENGEYLPTLKAWELGTLVLNRLDFLQTARPHLRKLNVETGESVYLATLKSREVVYLDVLESRYPIRINAAIGGSGPPHCSASGKLLLAYNPAVAAEYLASPLRKYTGKTLVKPADVQRMLDGIRRAGYSINDGEWMEGVCGVAAPVHNSHRLGIAAIGITALKERTNRQVLKHFTGLVREVALRVSRELGYRESAEHALQ
ncbi:MAG: IclR family transcriptional regulator [Burkholderiales bacterium]